jgi:hypothetical protein
MAFLCCFAAALAAQNDKRVIGDAVFTPAEIAEGASILYVIRFQNVGSDSARHVLVRDTLDPRLDGSTLNMVSASHEYSMLRDGSNNVSWYFEDIQLPGDEQNPGGAIGFIMFTVRPVPFVVPGQVITNSACIQFDQFNTVCTNEALIWIDTDADDEEPTPQAREYLVVPNPNYGQFVVQPQAGSADSAEWWITDVSGKTVWDGSAQDAASVNNQIMLERPSPGLYLLWVKTAGRLHVEQFAVIR